MVGTLASAAGCALGHWGAPHLAQLLVDGEAAPSWFTIRPVAWPLHAAFWTGPAVALAGVWAASRRAGRTGPAEALREADVDTGVLPPVRRLLGFALLAGAVFLMTKSLVTDASGLLKRKTYTTQPMVLITAAPCSRRCSYARRPGCSVFPGRQGCSYGRIRPRPCAAPPRWPLLS